MTKIVARLDDKTDATGYRKVLTRLTIKGSHSWSGLGFVAEGQTGRKEYQGPLVPGPWAYGFPLCHVIDNHGGTGAEQARLRDEGLLYEVTDGDEIEIDGVTYQVRISRSGRDAWVHLDNI